MKSFLHLDVHPLYMVNFCRFVLDEVETLDGLMEEARLAKGQRGDEYDKDTTYTLTTQGAFRLHAARILIEQNPNMYLQLNDPKCLYRLFSLEYVGCLQSHRFC